MVRAQGYPQKWSALLGHVMAGMTLEILHELLSRHDVESVFDVLYQLLWPTSDFSCNSQGGSYHPSSCLGLFFGGTQSSTHEVRNCRLRMRHGSVRGARGILGSGER